jgi:hypothetical protein
MMNVAITLALPLTSLLLIGCATSNPAPVPVTQQMLFEQEQMFNSLYFGQPISETMDLMAEYSANFFEVRQNDTIHHYIDAKYPGTNVLFGVYFEAGKLAALILEQDVVEFFLCRSSHGIAPYADWVKARNRLDGDFDKKAHHPETVVDEGFHPADVLIAMTYLPVLAIALPVAPYLYLADLVAGGPQKRKNLLQTAPTIQLGYSEEQLISLMGPYDRRDEVGPATAYTYSLPSYSYGLVDGQVVWRQSASMFQSSAAPRNSSTVLGVTNCGWVSELDGLDP